MTTFDEREKAMEAKFAHDEELRFKAMARANKLLGNWAAVQLGLAGEEAASYANHLVTANLENQTIDDTLLRVSGDLTPRGITKNQISEKMQEYIRVALQQLEAEI
ncbi:DUF1476 domain-containing protein [Bradyrhizobium sp. USDA 10063]